MKLFINKQPCDPDTPWGGGNAFLSRFVGHTQSKYNWDIVYELCDGIDVLFIIDPRDPRMPLIQEYKLENGTPIVQRVGDLGTHSKPYIVELLEQSMRVCDLAIYPSEWARDYLSARYIQSSSEVIIPNAADDTFFNKRSSVVTHHWSDNPMKGEDIYRKLDEDLPNLGIDFTFIGRIKTTLKNATHIQPLPKKELAQELSKHSIYLTASRLEAGANHVMEAMACGLFIIYRNSGGSIPEYCRFRGIEYSTYDDLRRIFAPLPSMLSMLEKYVTAIESVV